MVCSDKTRRGMKEALESESLSEEALSFVAGSAATRKSGQGCNITGERAEKPPPAMTGGDHHESVGEVGSSSWNPQPDLCVVLPGFISLSFRLPATLAYRLARVSAERKLLREHPFTQQAIVIDALNRWLDRHAPNG